MKIDFTERIKALKEASPLLLDGNWGIEKEALRTTKSGDLALTEHPAVFGDRETNPYITTDFSESQVELITPVFNSIEETYQSLLNTQNYVESNCKNEFLWPFSMPNKLPSEDIIPIARFKNKEPEIYRKGLALRYGKKMQMISGLHYNYSPGNDFIDFLYKETSKPISLKDFKNNLYFHTGRNVLRYRWLLLYLFGASPAADNSYSSSIENHFNKIEKILSCCKDSYSEHRKYSTSLRMSCIGYKNHIPYEHSVSYNSLNEYLTDLKFLLNNKDKTYSKFGIFKGDNQIQLNDNYLQKINEYYSPIRFKYNKGYNSSPLDVLAEKGVAYIELRILDLNPFYKASITLEDLYFIHTFILFCMFKNCPNLNDSELLIINRNHHITALKGRKPGIELSRLNGEETNLIAWGEELINEMAEIAELLDSESDSSNFSRSLNIQKNKLNNPDILPSSKIVNQMDYNKESFIELGIRLSKENRLKEKKYELSNAGV